MVNMEEQKDPLEPLDEMVEEIMKELQIVHSGVYYEPDKARRTAAKALSIQIYLSKFLASKEADSKSAKLEIDQSEADEYFQAIPSEGKKPSDAYLDRAISKSQKVKETKIQQIKAEQEWKQWLYVFNALKEAHIFFRSIGNSKEQF